MTQQGKIREWLANYCHELRQEGVIHKPGFTPESDADDILGYLISHGVVLKVEKGVPENPFEAQAKIDHQRYLEKFPDFPIPFVNWLEGGDILAPTLISAMLAYKRALHDIHKAGFTATEPLVAQGKTDTGKARRSSAASRHGCPFPTSCNKFPCEEGGCNADVCSNGYAYRMS